VKNLLVGIGLVTLVLVCCIGNAKEGGAETDVFPIRPNLQYSYRFYNNWTESWGQQVSAIIDSGSVTCIVRDSTLSGDTMVVWAVEQERANWHWTSFNASVDTPHLTRDTTILNLLEMRSGRHELRVAGAVWSFPLASVDEVQQPVFRYSDSAAIRFTLTSWINSGAHSEDSVSLAESVGLTRRSFSGWFDSIPWQSYFGDAVLLGTPTAVTRHLSATPTTFVLHQNYPNPFNPTTTIRFALPQRSHVTLTVFNTLGQQVATLIHEIQEPGEHSVRLDGSRLASGVYFYRLQAGEYVASKRLVLVR
jgi:hypothetical protein